MSQYTGIDNNCNINNYFILLLCYIIDIVLLHTHEVNYKLQAATLVFITWFIEEKETDSCLK